MCVTVSSQLQRYLLVCHPRVLSRALICSPLTRYGLSDSNFQIQTRKIAVNYCVNFSNVSTQQLLPMAMTHIGD